jgi:hypothetical protein
VYFSAAGTSMVFGYVLVLIALGMAGFVAAKLSRTAAIAVVLLSLTTLVGALPGLLNAAQQYQSVAIYLPATRHM